MPTEVLIFLMREPGFFVADDKTILETTEYGLSFLVLTVILFR